MLLYIIWRLSALTAFLKWAQLRHSWCLFTLHILKRNIWAYFPEKWIQILSKNNKIPRPEITHAGFCFEYAQNYRNERKSIKKCYKQKKVLILDSLQHCMIFHARIKCQTHLQTSLLKSEVLKQFCKWHEIGTATPCASLHQDPCNISGKTGSFNWKENAE